RMANKTNTVCAGACAGPARCAAPAAETESPRGLREDIWAPASPPPPPICPRRRRYGVPERLDFEGNVVVPLDEDAVRRALRRMKLQGVDSLAVVLLFSFVNATHERRGREVAPPGPPRPPLSPPPPAVPAPPPLAP